MGGRKHNKCRTIYNINVGSEASHNCSEQEQCFPPLGAFPENAVFVAKAWIDGIQNPFRQYTTIQSAVDFIKTTYPNRRSDSRFAVIIYPGSYTENVMLDHNIDLVGYSDASAYISSITYISTVDVTFQNTMVLKNILVTTITINTNVVGQGAFYRFVIDSITGVGDPSIQFTGNTGELDIYDSRINSSANSRDIIFQSGDTIMKVYSSDVGGKNYFNGCKTYFYACEIGYPDGATNIYSINGDDASISLVGCTVHGLNLTNGTECIASGTKFQNKAVIVDSTSHLSAPNSTFTLQPTGSGILNIAMIPFNVTTTGSATTVSGQFNFSDTNYSISWTQTSGTATVPIINNITSSSFDINGPNGAVYRISVSKINDSISFP